MTTCHDITPGRLEQMYPSKIDEQHREWIEKVFHVPSDTHSAAAKIVVAACKCVNNILLSAGTPVYTVEDMNACHLDLSCSRTWALEAFSRSTSGG